MGLQKEHKVNKGRIEHDDDESTSVLIFGHCETYMPRFSMIWKHL